MFPSVVFSVESWEQYYNDPARAGLWAEHYAELESAHEGKLVMAPDTLMYEALDKIGILQIVVARRAGKMIGYCLAVIKRHIHYAETCAFEDSYFITKLERRGLVGLELFKFVLADMTRRGAVRAYFMTKEFASVAKLFERLGMTRIDSVYAIWLGGAV
jgi:N-acetylglutamate synthase-like GNAT family acetyltransferase